MSFQPITIFFQGNIVPKSRPNTGRGGRVYMPDKYTNSRKVVEEAIKEVYNGPPLKQPLKITCTYFVNQKSSSAIKLVVGGPATGGKQGKGDLDNIMGTIMDACENAGLIYNDSLFTDVSIKRRLTILEQRAIITISPDNEILSDD